MRVGRSAVAGSIESKRAPALRQVISASNWRTATGFEVRSNRRLVGGDVDELVDGSTCERHPSLAFILSFELVCTCPQSVEAPRPSLSFAPASIP